MRPHIRLAAGAAAVALTLGLSACTSAEDPPDGTAASGAPSASGSPSVSNEGEALDLGPLEDYLGVGGGIGRNITDAEDREYDEAIARCMAEEGFEYVPWVDPNIDATFTPDGAVTLQVNEPSFPDLPPAEFAARFGYGLSTKPAAAQEEEKNPNDAILARMSVAERVAYHQAMYGDDNALDNEGYLAGNGIASSDSSCQGRASAGEPTTDDLARVEERAEKVRDSFASLLKRVRDLREDQMKDARVIAATSTWSTCLAAAGHPGFTALEQPRARALDDARKLLGNDLSAAAAAAADPTRLAALRKAEVELAVADERCLRDWQDTFKAVKRDLQDQFVRGNLAELEKYRTAMSAAVGDQD